MRSKGKRKKRNLEVIVRGSLKGLHESVCEKYNSAWQMVNDV